VLSTTEACCKCCMLQSQHYAHRDGCMAVYCAFARTIRTQPLLTTQVVALFAAKSTTQNS
jgi:hypothetical protein